MLKKYVINMYLCQRKIPLEPSNKINIRFIFIVIIFYMVQAPLYSLEEKDFNEAVEQLQASNRLYSQGLEYFKQGDNKNALDLFSQCVDKMPRHAYALFYLANLSYIQQDFEQALVYMKQAVDNVDYIQELSDYIDKKKIGQIDAFRETLEDMWDSTNSCRDSRAIEFAMLHADKGESDLELASKKRKLEMKRLKAHYIYFYGNILFQMKRIPEAFKEYKEAIRLNPQHASAYNNLAAICYLAKEYPAAISVLEEAEQHGLEEQINLKLKEMVYKAMNRPVEGILQEDLSRDGKGVLGVMRFALIVRQQESLQPPLYENCYIVFDPETKEAVIIDPGERDERLENYIYEHNLQVKAVLNTHGHSDHIGANDYYAELFEAPICYHKNDAEYYDKYPEFYLDENINTDFTSFSIKVIHTPGHTPGSVCFLVNNFLFSGDTLFKNNIGRVWERDGKTEDIIRKNLIKVIREKLLVLPGQTIICPGHGSISTISEEIKNNTFFN